MRSVIGFNREENKYGIRFRAEIGLIKSTIERFEFDEDVKDDLWMIVRVVDRDILRGPISIMQKGPLYLEINPYENIEVVVSKYLNESYDWDKMKSIKAICVMGKEIK